MKVEKVIKYPPFEPFDIVIHVETKEELDKFKAEIRLLHDAVDSHQQGRVGYDMSITVVGEIMELICVGG